MTQAEKKRVADEVIEKSVELFGLTPDELSDKNEEWMIGQGYKKGSLQTSTYDDSKPILKYTLLEKLLRQFREK
jgi:hypothetical protein